MMLKPLGSDASMTLGTHIYFKNCGVPISPKGMCTDIYIVKSKQGNFNLGLIKWHCAWRKYSFFPEPETLYEEDCLREIAEFIERETAVHRAARKAARNV